MFLNRLFLLFFSGLLVFFLQGCTDKKEHLTGTRVPILETQILLSPDTDAANFNIEIDEPTRNGEWPQVAYAPSHLMPHTELGDMTRVVWKESIGSGSSKNAFLLAAPVIHQETIYTLDSRGLVMARHSKTGKRIWTYKITPKLLGSDCLGGGISVDQGRLYIGFSSADVIALDASQGILLWETNIGHPIRSAPTVKDGRVYVITKNNKIFALNTSNGKKIWQHEGGGESCGLLGGGPSAVAHRTVIVPYSSGEVFALKGENGYPLWTESLTALKSFSSISMMSQIKGAPVIDKNLVFIASQSGRVMALDFRTGSRVWEKEIGSINTPFINGNFLFLVTTANELVCLVKDTGQIVWVVELPRFDNPQTKTDPITWVGPLLAGNKLIIAGSRGKGRILNPQTGALLSEFSLPGAVHLSPIVVDKMIYFLTDEGTLIAME